MKFTHKVSKGSRFNQIYIPQEFKEYFEVGDIIEVKLLKKNNELHFSRKIQLSDFKKKIIKEIFNCLNEFKEIKQVFVFGSFLTKKVDYNDIDIMIISDKLNENKAYDLISEKVNMKIHIITMPEAKLEELKKICPLTRSMFYYSISNRQFLLEEKSEIDKKHLEFLLMMPEDILKINVDGKTLYNNIRRLITIENFIKNKSEDPLKVNAEIENIINKNIQSKINDNEQLSDEEIKKLKSIIKNKLNKIRVVAGL